MYTPLLVTHSYWRWLLLAAALLAVSRAFLGWRLDRPWTPADDRAGRLFTVAFDLQLLMGLLLYVAYSPVTQVAFQNFGAAMRDSVLRFFAVEHIFGMVVAIALVHIGRAKSQRVHSRLKHRAAFIYFGLGFLVMLASIPWPGLPAGRPLFWH